MATNLGLNSDNLFDDVKGRERERPVSQRLVQDYVVHNDALSSRCITREAAGDSCPWYKTNGERGDIEGVRYNWQRKVE
jgi:hypothetical protein